MDHSENTLRDCIQAIFPMSASANAEIRRRVEFLPAARGEVFIKQEAANRYEYFLIEGVCRSFLIDPQGEDITISFFQGASVLSPHSVRTVRERSFYNFQACTDILLGRLDAADFMRLMIAHPEVRDFGNTVMRLELMRKVEREVGLAVLTARERLLKFREQFSMLENLVPHTQIASYLGISAISLSRLRSDIARE